MQLRSIRIKNFRSITKASTIAVGPATTVLIGPNNEGKSNVLRALVLAVDILLGRVRRHAARRYGLPPDDVYFWPRDFPVQLQEQKPNGESEFILDFFLTPTDEEEFSAEVGSRVKGNLPIRILVGDGRDAKISFHKKGPGGKKVTEKKAQISDFVAARFDLEYIPAIRTASQARDVVDSLVARELHALEDDESYVRVLRQIEQLQQPVLDELSASINGTLRQFLPAVQGVSVEVAPRTRSEALRRTQVFVDDGTRTELAYKGDGVQSLAALALMRHASEKRRRGKAVVLAVEEPESHLHPSAIHELHEVLSQLAENHQVVISTHCPLFVNRNDVSHNVLVSGGQARPARNIGEIRDVLGVRVSDNLRHAELMLIVEGEDDRMALRAVLAESSESVARAFRQNRLAIDTLNGAANLSYKLGELRDAMCKSVYCFLDADAAGIRAINKAKSERLLRDANFSTTLCAGLDEAELEDLFDRNLVARVLHQEFSVMTMIVQKQLRRRKWSDRARHAFVTAGKTWDAKTERDAKGALAREVARTPALALEPGRRAVIDNLIQVLESRLQSAANPRTAPA